MDVISMSINSQILPTQKMQMLREVKKKPFRCDTQNCTCGTCKSWLQLKMLFNLCVSSREGGKMSIGRHEWAHGPTDLG